MEFDWPLGWFPSPISSTSSRVLSTILQLRSKSDMAVYIGDIGTTPRTNTCKGLTYKVQVRLSCCMGPGQRAA
jgi:hypothetical protein